MLPSRAAPRAVWLALCLLPAAAIHVLAAAFDVYARLIAWTRPVEWLRPDALPFSLAVLALTAALLSLRGRAWFGRGLAARAGAAGRVGFLLGRDPLTRLPNRALLHDRLGQCVARARRDRTGGERVALLLLDLDRFRDVSHVLGPAAGDLVLAEAAERLRVCGREADTVAWFGGNRFAVLLSGLHHAADSAAPAERFMAALTRSYHPDDQEVRLAVSAGVAVYPDDADGAEELIKNAEFALHEAKAAGGGRYRFFLADLKARVEARRAMEAQLASALARGEFALHYQPAVAVEDGRVELAEALLRWRHPERGLLAPHEFLPAAEDSGQIAAIGDWVLRAACADAKVWRDAGLPLPVAVNLPRAQLERADLVAKVAEALQAAGLEPEALELEVTERALEAARHARGGDAVPTRLRELHEMGVGLAFDDFGTGTSSLSLLKDFPGQRLKIDRAFVRGMLRDPGDAAIVRGIINLAHSLGLRVVAEGVESREQLDFLRVQGCDAAQGHHVARPMPAEGLARLLRREPAARPRVPAIAAG